MTDHLIIQARRCSIGDTHLFGPLSICPSPHVFVEKKTHACQKRIVRHRTSNACAPRVHAVHSRPGRWLATRRHPPRTRIEEGDVSPQFTQSEKISPNQLAPPPRIDDFRGLAIRKTVVMATGRNRPLRRRKPTRHQLGPQPGRSGNPAMNLLMVEKNNGGGNARDTDESEVVRWVGI